MNETLSKIEYSESAPSRGWLKVKAGDRVTRFAWPPFRGTHQGCYEAIAQDKELVPAEGYDLAVLTNGAYTQGTKQWQSVKGNFRSNWVRCPNRSLLICAGSFEGDNSLSGILVERDVEGKGLSTTMQVPDLTSWKQNSEGVYVPDNSSYKAVFAPLATFDRKSFEKDAVAHAHLTPEGAELFAKTASDAGLTPHDWLAERMKSITSNEQNVSLLLEGVDGLDLGGLWGDGGGGFAFGVSVSA